MEAIAAKHVQFTGAMFGAEFDYSVESVAELDCAIANFHAPGEAMESTILGYGAYLGETIRRTFGGEWVQGDEGVWVESPQGAKAYVLNWVSKRFQNGKEDLLSHKYAFVAKEFGLADSEVPALMERLQKAFDLPDTAAESGESVQEGEESPDPEDVWRTLGRVPLLLYALVLKAKGKSEDEKLANWLFAVLEVAKSDQGPCPLVKRALTAYTEDELVNEAGVILAAVELSELIERNYLEDELKKVGEILITRFSSEEAVQYRGFLMALGEKMAIESSGLFGFGKKLGKKHQEALAQAAEWIGYKEE
jgi:hypothetical protein